MVHDKCYKQAMESHDGKWSARAAQQTAKCRKKQGIVNDNSNLKRWEEEKWTDQKGRPCGSGEKNEIVKCRPSKKVSKKTPVSWKELSPARRKKVIDEKKKIGMGKKAPAVVRTGASPRGNLKQPPSDEEFKRRKERQLLYKPFPSKDGKTKYSVYVKNGEGGKRLIKFGDVKMEHYFDKIGYYSSKNHNDKVRLKRFRDRFESKYDPNDKDSRTWWSWRKLW